MMKPDAAAQEPIVARLVHRSVLVEQSGQASVFKLMFNLRPQGRAFEAGSDVAFAVPGGTEGAPELRYYTIESVGQVPFEDSIDITIYVRELNSGHGSGTAHHLIGLQTDDSVALYGPYPYPFYVPMGSRSNMILIGAGSGMVPFRWLAQKVQARRLDWMGKVLMLEGDHTGLEHLYHNHASDDRHQYFDAPSFRAFEALKTRYSASALDRGESVAGNMDALWRLIGQGSVYVYLAGYRGVAEAMHEAMERHLRLPGRWADAKAALVRDGHWLEYLYG